MTDEQWMQEFAKCLEQKMIRAGFNQRMLSQISGVSETTISRYLSASQMPKFLAVIKISKALKTNISEFNL